MSTILPVEVLKDCEDDLASELSSVNTASLCKELFQEGIITSKMSEDFFSLDHNRLDFKIQIRYILRLASMNVMKDITLWDKFLNFLGSSKIVSRVVTDKLNKSVSDVNSVSTDIFQTHEHLNSTDGGGTCVEKVLSRDNVGLITEILVPVSTKWEEISIALGLQEHDRADFRDRSTRLCLSKTIECWITRESKPILGKLVQALRSELVGEGRMALDLERKFKEAKVASQTAKKFEPFESQQCSRRRDTNSFLTIKTSYHTDVEDGKSTILFVQATPREGMCYQWKKNNHPLPSGSNYFDVHDDLLVVRHASQGTEGEYSCCVTRQEKELFSNKITLTVIFHPAKKRLLNLYSAKTEIPKDSWPPTVSKMFINLALIKSKNSIHNIDYSVHGSADVIIADKEKIEYNEVFGKYKNEELILLEGRPGSGKTTLVNKVVKDWAKGKVLIQASYLIFVSLRVLSSEGRNETLSDILGVLYSNDEELTTVRDYLEKNDGERVCFVIDGLDEYQPQNKKESVIYKLLNKVILPKAMIIVSSRPSATTNLEKCPVTKRVEVFGFSKKEVFEYIDNFEFDSPKSDAEKLKKYLLSNPNIYDLCYLPVHAAMICFLFKYDQECTSDTQTKIYEQFTKLIVYRHLISQNIAMNLQSLSDLSGAPKKYFDDLCHLAFEMTTKLRLVISQSDLDFHLSKSVGSHGDEFCLGLLTVYDTIHLTGHSRNYSFLHMTFQEFLAAYHIASLDTDKQWMLIYKYSKQKYMCTVWTFHCGLTGFQFGLSFIRDIYYKDCLNSVVGLHYVYEAQQQLACDELVEAVEGIISIQNEMLTPMDLIKLGYLISETTQPVKTIILQELQYDETLEILLELMCKSNLRYLTYLELPCVYGNSTFPLFMNTLKVAPNLQTLELRIKNISFIEANILVKQLYGLKYLTIHSSIGSNSISALVKGLSTLTSELVLSFQDVNPAGASALGNALKLHTTAKLGRLVLKNSNVGSEGMAALVRGLQHLTKLSKLKLQHCEIEQVGFSCFWNGLPYIQSLTKLHLSNIYLVGGDSIASYPPPSYFSNLLKLTMAKVKFGRSWICLVCELKYHNNLQCLILTNTDIDFDKDVAVPYALKYQTKLQHLDLSHNNIGAAGIIAISKVLEYLLQLKHVNISGNNIDLEGANGFVASLGDHRWLRQIKIGYKYEFFDMEFMIIQGLISPQNVSAFTNLIGGHREYMIEDYKASYEHGRGLVLYINTPL